MTVLLPSHYDSPFLTPAHSDKRPWSPPFICIDLGFHGSLGSMDVKKLTGSGVGKRKTWMICLLESFSCVSGYLPWPLHALFVSIVMIQIYFVYTVPSFAHVRVLVRGWARGLSDGTWLSLLSPIWELSAWYSHILLGQCRSVTDLIMLVFTWGFICIPTCNPPHTQTKAG